MKTLMTDNELRASGCSIVAPRSRRRRASMWYGASPSPLEIAHTRAVGLASKATDTAFWIVYGLIGLEINLQMLGARRSEGFARFVDAVTTPLVAPFHGLWTHLTTDSVRGVGTSVVALVAYVMLNLALHGLLRLYATGKHSVAAPRVA